jgi:beta-glucanase (GH16 family)
MFSSISLSVRLTNSATGQLPDIGPFQLIDRDTPESAYTHTSFETGETWDLVFSDEFNTPGRTFWPGGKCLRCPLGIWLTCR